MGFAFVLAGLAYFAKKHFWDANGGKGRKFFSRDTYEFSALQPSDSTNVGEDSIPLTKGNKQFMTSRELLDAFGDSSDEDYVETTQVVFENSYMDEYMNENEKVENEIVDEKNTDGGNASGSG